MLNKSRTKKYFSKPSVKYLYACLKFGRVVCQVSELNYLFQNLTLRFVVSGEVSTEVREKRQSDKYIDDRKVVCYYANWAVYRQGDAKFTPQNINPYLCTHLIYAFGGLGKDDTLVPFDEYQDIEKGNNKSKYQ